MGLFKNSKTQQSAFCPVLGFGRPNIGQLDHLPKIIAEWLSGPKARPHASLGHRPRFYGKLKSRAESPHYRVKCENLLHNNESGFQPSFFLLGTFTWGFAPGWYGNAPLALNIPYSFAP